MTRVDADLLALLGSWFWGPAPYTLRLAAGALDMSRDAADAHGMRVPPEPDDGRRGGWGHGYAGRGGVGGWGIRSDRVLIAGAGPVELRQPDPRARLGPGSLLMKDFPSR